MFGHAQGIGVVGEVERRLRPAQRDRRARSQRVEGGEDAGFKRLEDFFGKDLFAGGRVVLAIAIGFMEAGQEDQHAVVVFVDQVAPRASSRSKSSRFSTARSSVPKG